MQWGNSSTASSTFTVDTTAPAVAFTAEPASLISETSADFAWGGSDNLCPACDLVYDTKLDDAGWSCCGAATSAHLSDLAEGLHTYSVRATDLAGNVSVADSCSFTVAVNHAPVVNAVSVSTNQDTAVQITLNGTDIDGDALTYAIVGGPGHGNLGTVSGAKVTYTPNAGWTGSDSFTYKANDGHLDSNTATVTITVKAVNHAPVVNAVSVSTNQDTAVQITLNGTDIDGDALTYAIVGGPGHGNLGTVSGAKVTYTPNAGWTGSDSFTYKANDGHLDSNTATVTITVKAVNHAPVVNAVSVSTNQDTAVQITLNGS